MKQIFLSLTLFSILAILPANIFAQSSDDLDGDGVKNSEDACPKESGTKANKGCPGKNSQPPTPKQKVKLKPLSAIQKEVSPKAVEFFNKGKAFWKSLDIQKAIDAYAEAIKIEPNYAAALCERGTMVVS